MLGLLAEGVDEGHTLLYNNNNDGNTKDNFKKLKMKSSPVLYLRLFKEVFLY